MDIVLVRHALAQECSPSLRDEQRRLVSKGRKQTLQALSALKGMLHAKRDVVILTSPALRASQTAELLAEGLDGSPVRTVNGLYDGSVAALTQALADVPTEACVLVVGHEPLLGMWAEQLSGHALRFKKSGMAGFRRVTDEPLALEPVWLYRAEPADRDTPDMPSQPRESLTADAFSKIMIHRVLQVDDMRRDFLKRPEQPVTVHRYRVALRQCRSLLSFMRPALKDKRTRSMQAALKAMSDRLADLRETDVLTQHWRAFLVERPEYAREEGISRVLADVRAFQQRDAVDYAAEASVGEILRKVLRWVDSWSARKGKKGLHRAAIKRHDRWARDIQEGLEKLNVEDLPATHSLRLKIKKLRYARTAIPMLQQHPGPNLEQLKALQDDLGEICDTHVHLTLLRQLVPDGEAEANVPQRDAFMAWLEDMRDDISARVKPRRTRQQQPPRDDSPDAAKAPAADAAPEDMSWQSE